MIDRFAEARHLYFAHPIDSASIEGHELTLMVEAMLHARRVPHFSPKGAWQSINAASKASAVHAANLTALWESSCVLALCPDGQSIGVPAEMQAAYDAGTPVVVISDNENSLVLRALATAGIYPTSEDGVREAIGRAAGIMQSTKPGIHPPAPTLVVGVQRDPDVRQWPLPKQTKHGDIGLDLYVSDETTVPAGEWRGIPSRIKVAPPDGFWFLIAGRSSSLSGRGLQVQTSVIDAGYRGYLFALAYNITTEPVTVKPGDRIAQLLPLPLARMACLDMDVLPDSERGEDGFGSTGA